MSVSARGDRGSDLEADLDAPVRTVVVHCPHWPVVAAGLAAPDLASPDAPVVVVRANRVVAASAAARLAGITAGLRRRQAQSRCPHVVVLDHDPLRDARWFEPVASAFDAVTPVVEVSEPGTLAFASRGPSRYFGGDQAMAERTTWIATGAAGGAEVGVGVADGAFAALLAARRAVRNGHPVVVEPGGSPSFLAPIPVAALGQAAVGDVVGPDLTDLFVRLGLRSLAHVASLEVADVLGRFGEPGVVAHRLARGLDPRPLQVRRPAPELSVSREVDPPAEQVDRAAFVARTLAVEFQQILEADGLACTHVMVEAETEHGETLARHWRQEGALSPAALVDRVRWQIEGWLGGSAASRPTAGIARLTLVPVEVVAAKGRQLGFWGGETLVDERILRAVARIQGTLGSSAVCVPEVRGGRSPADRVERVPVDAVDLTASRPATRPSHVVEPWPGRVPDPAPATVLADPEPVEVVDAQGRLVGVTGRAEVTAAPTRLVRPGHPPESVVGWAGPWPVDERWWDPARHRRRARFQVVGASGAAHLLAVESGRWWLEATYD
ncbi:MAG: DNA polymerase Y family protein [Acidimicrobiales bacterium]|nr:DNA polymerase Y family protein [Acidimicrobiales bacterium]